jgi:hypothetical protein
MTTPLPPTGDESVEELAQPDRRSVVRRLRLDLALGGAVLIIVLLLMKRSWHSDNDGWTPTPSPSIPTSTATTRVPEVPPIVPSVSLAVFPADSRRAGNVARCPAGFTCPVSNIASAGVRAALESAYPGARILSARTVRAIVDGYGQTIWTVDVRARAGAELIQLRIQPVSPEDDEQYTRSLFGGHSITHWESLLSQVLVVIDVVTPADEPASLAAVEQLARDSRMLSPW